VRLGRGKTQAILNGIRSRSRICGRSLRFTTLRSTLAVPLEGLNGVVGVLAMYRTDRDAFSPDHLRILLAVSSKIALSVENALKYQQAEDSATTDYLTGLPNPAHCSSIFRANWRAAAGPEPRLP